MRGARRLIYAATAAGMFLRPGQTAHVEFAVGQRAFPMWDSGH